MERSRMRIIANTDMDGDKTWPEKEGADLSE